MTPDRTPRGMNFCSDAYLSGNLEDYEYPEAKIREALERLPKINL